MPAKDRMRVAVVGAQNIQPESSHAYTVYQTAVSYDGQVYQRLLRFSEFRKFYRQLKVRKNEPSDVPFPPRTWTRSSAMSTAVVEKRQVMLNEFMRAVCRSELSSSQFQALLKLVRVGEFESQNTEARGTSGNSVYSFKPSLVGSEMSTLSALNESERGRATELQDGNERDHSSDGSDDQENKVSPYNATSSFARDSSSGPNRPSALHQDVSSFDDLEQLQQGHQTNEDEDVGKHSMDAKTGTKEVSEEDCRDSEPAIAPVDMEGLDDSKGFMGRIDRQIKSINILLTDAKASEEKMDGYTTKL